MSTEFFRKCDYKLITQKQPREVSYKKGLLKHFAKFTRKYLCWNLFFNKLANLRPLFNKRLQHRCFLVNFMKFLRIPFLQNTSQPLILIITFLETQFEIDKLLDFCRYRFLHKALHLRCLTGFLIYASGSTMESSIYCTVN